MGLLSMLGVADRASLNRRRRRAYSPSLYPTAETLEDRVVLSHAAAEVAPAVVGNLQLSGSGNVNITDIDIDPDDLVREGDVLKLAEGATATVTGTLAGLPFTATITELALQLVPDDTSTPGTECSVLDLKLAPIDIDLLGLHVDTSAICLSITAFEGEGILGDLLCDLAGGKIGLLDDGVLDGLTDGLSEVLTGALRKAGPAASDALDICDGECEILNLAIGPVDLNLLGVNVHLDNCADPEGPVQVCVSASKGEGILGDLLCGLAEGGVVLPDLGKIEDLVKGILKDFDINATQKQIDKLVNQVTRALRDGNLSFKDIAQLTKSVSKLLRKV